MKGDNLMKFGDNLRILRKSKIYRFILTFDIKKAVA